MQDNITYKCSYADQTVLWGCGVEAINIRSGNIDYTSNLTYYDDTGFINELCDGIYNVTCYGIPYPTSSDRIIYNNSNYYSLISVTGSECTCVVASSSAVTPTIVPISQEGK